MKNCSKNSITKTIPILVSKEQRPKGLQITFSEKNFFYSFIESKFIFLLPTYFERIK